MTHAIHTHRHDRLSAQRLASRPGPAARLAAVAVALGLAACGASAPVTSPDAALDPDASRSDAGARQDDAGSRDAATSDASRDVGIDALADDAGAPDAALTDAYAPPPVFERWVTDGIEAYVVPPGVFRVHVIAEGASGGDVSNGDASVCLGGNGARVETTVGVFPGETLRVLVGRHPVIGAFGSDGCGASGGGGTFVVRGEREALAVAGGGGGATGYFGCGPSRDASLDSGGGASAFGDPRIGGRDGAGGAAYVEGGGGGGLLGDGANGDGTGGGLAFVNGGVGGARAFTEGCDGGPGGLGGGGGGGDDHGGGGGGYSGGASQGGGGGSIAMGSDTSITVRVDRGDGHVRIEPL